MFKSLYEVLEEQKADVEAYLKIKTKDWKEFTKEQKEKLRNIHKCFDCDKIDYVHQLQKEFDFFYFYSFRNPETNKYIEKCEDAKSFLIQHLKPLIPKGVKLCEIDQNQDIGINYWAGRKSRFEFFNKYMMVDIKKDILTKKDIKSLFEYWPIERTKKIDKLGLIFGTNRVKNYSTIAFDKKDWMWECQFFKNYQERDGKKKIKKLTPSANKFIEKQTIRARK